MDFVRTDANPGGVDWAWKLREAIDRIKNNYDYIGRSTGAPFLAIVYPPEVESAVLKEWRTLSSSFGSGFEIIPLNILTITSEITDQMGVENVVNAIQNPMPGSDAEVDLANLWLSDIVNRVREILSTPAGRKRIITLDHLAALYPATGPRALMQALWDNADLNLNCPVVIFIPGKMDEARVYEFLSSSRELMYRGDIL